jgi:hypothetical protein
MPHATETAYLPEIECTAREGMLDTLIVGVEDETGSRQHLRVAKGFVTKEGKKHYLMVDLVELDRPKQLVLVELPVESDSGFRRLWVPVSRFRKQRGTP